MKSIIYTLFSICLIFTLVGCGNNKKESDNNTEQNTDRRIVLSKEQFIQNNMVIGSIEKKPFPTIVQVNGMIDVPPENRAVVNSSMGGYIKTTPLLVGDIVKKGQVLATIENLDFVTMQQEYLEIKEQLNYLKSEYDRQKTMFNENISSQKSYFKAESNYKTAVAKYNGFKKQLTMLNISPTNVESGNITSVIRIYAPISGSITKVNVSKGTYVSPAASIMEIIDNDHIHLELSVFEKDIMKVKKEQKIKFKIPEASEETFDAKVYLVGTAIDENRTIKVHGHPLDESNRFLTGMFVNADIITDSNVSNALPETAIVEIDESHYVLVLDEEDNSDYYFKQIKVGKGKTFNGYTEIHDNVLLKASDKFLVNGAFSLIGNE